MSRLLFALPLLLTGCWRAAEQLDQVVWADDDSALLIARLRFDERAGSPGAGTTNKRDFRHQLVLADPDGSNDVELGDERVGQNLAELYLMVGAGYALSGALDDDARTSWSQTDLASGTPRPVPPLTADDAGFAIPSPDGASIAQVASDGGQVRFLAASDLTTLGSAPLEPPANDWTWRPGGAFVVVRGGAAHAVAPDGTLTPTDVPTCLSPKTTSSSVSATGVPVFPSGDSVAFGAADPSQAFGCP